MAVRKLDGFDHYNTSQLARKATSISAVTPTVVYPGRFGGGCMNWDNYLRGTTDTFDDQATWIVGFAYRSVTTAPTTSVVLLSFMDSGTLQCELRLQSTGILQATRSGTQIGVGSSALLVDTWYYIETKVTISDAAGVFNVKINGVNDINLTSVDTKNTANATANQVRLGQVTNHGFTSQWDDFYVFDGTGSVNNDFNGPARVATFWASEAGNSAQFTGTPGPNFANANDMVSDDEGSYNYTPTANNIDSFKFDDPGITTGVATAYQHVITARTDGAGARSLAAHQRSGSTNYAESGKALSSSWAMYRFPRDTNPATSAQITATELRDAEFGYKLIS